MAELECRTVGSAVTFSILLPPFLKPGPTWDFAVVATDCGDQWQDDCEFESEPVSPNPFTIGLESPHGDRWPEGPVRSLVPSP